VNLTNGVTGTLPVANGGTGATSLTNSRVVYTASGVLATDADFLFDGTTVTLPGGTTVLPGAGGTRMNLSITGSSSIGPDGGGETWLAYPAFDTAYMSNSLIGDCVMRFGGRLLIGSGPESGGNSQVMVSDHWFGIGDGLVPLAPFHLRRPSPTSDSCSGTPSDTDCSTSMDEGSCVARPGCTWNGANCEGTAECGYGNQGDCEGAGCSWGGANGFPTITWDARWDYDGSNYMTLVMGSNGSATFDLVGTSPDFTFSDPVNINGLLTLSAQNIATDTTTGTKIGTATTQKIGFYNATPVVQPTALTTQQPTPHLVLLIMLSKT
jgi:hypothetical protein